jgi:enterochelin esterase-like enzyme
MVSSTLPAVPTTTQAATDSPTITVGTPTGTPEPIKITPDPSPTKRACLRAGGRVEVFEFTTPLLRDPLIYRIYLPPCYDEDTQQAYPVLYLIHGQTYSDTQWDRLGVPEAANKLIASGQASAFIVVMPRDRVWLEPTEDDFGLAVEQALVSWIDEYYRTIPDRAHRAVGGLSRGGAWAVDIGFSHPEVFGAVGVHSGFVFQSDIQPIYQWLNDIPEGMTPRIYLDIGNADRPEMLKSASWLEALLTRFDIPHEWHMFAGEHEEEYWRAHVNDYLRWYTQEW